MPIRAAAAAAVTDVQSAAALEKAIANGAKRIRVTADFSLDRTFYVTGETTIFAGAKHKLTRAAGFGGDLFVVGEDKKGVSALSKGKTAVLTLGDPASGAADLLTIDGNREKMKVPVTGTVIFTCASGEANVYGDVSIVNHQKTSNSRTLEARYNLPNPENIGGAAAITVQGVLNIHGGRFENNAVNDEADTGAEEPDKTSSTGAVIFNYSNLYVYGGTFTGNRAARGGAIYNYRMARIYGGTFSDNTASTIGGVVYQPDSQYSETLIGGNGTEGSILFADNRSAGIGGAIFVQSKAALIIYGNTVFRGNVSQNSNGGAICCYGTLTASGVEFENNSACQRGGALYVTNADEELTTRYCTVTGSAFRGNRANRGGAVGIFASESTYAEGGKAGFTDCVFENNATADLTPEGTATDLFGGAIYLSRKGTLDLSGCTFTGNSAVDEGGVLYASGESTAAISDCTFTGNSVTKDQEGSGGVMAIHSAKLSVSDSAMSENTAAKNGGAMYISYASASTVDSSVKLENVRFEKNQCGNYGGALYATAHVEGSKEPVITAKGTTFAENHSPFNGGGAYFTGGSRAYLYDTVFRANVSDAQATSSGSRYGGGAVYVTGAEVECNKAVFENNTSDYNAGAVGLYSGGTLTLNDFTASGNTAVNNGGFLYMNNAELKAWSGTLSGNSAKGGGAVNVYTSGRAGLYGVAFTGNNATNNGGAMYLYTDGSEVLLHDCELSENTAANYGGAVYASNGTNAFFYNTAARENTAAQGGFLYETATGTTVTLNGMTAADNTASSAGPFIQGNSTKAVLNVNKTNYKDESAEGELDDAYWAEAAAGKLTVNEITDEIPGYSGYSHREEETPEETAPKLASVKTILALGKKSSAKPTGTAVDDYPELDKSSNFMSLNTTTFKSVNGKTVTVDSFVYKPNRSDGNPNYAEGLLIYQAMLYKEKHPDKKVSIDISSFRFSVNASICLNRNSPYFGYMRHLSSKVMYDEYGYVKIAYLLVMAASMGIQVNVIGQLDAYPKAGIGFNAFFTQYLNSACDKNYAPGHKVGDYLDFHFCHWTSYGDDAATDMMHTKICAVSNYTDMNGKDHGNAVWSSSANLDGVTTEGYNGNNNVQTGTIVSDHKSLYQTARNYLRLLGKYCGQEDVYLFRELVIQRTKEQVRLINAGKEDQIPTGERIVYLGTEKDSVFELFFTPIGGDSGVWDPVHNPYCKYVDKLAGSDDYIYFIWNNAKFNYYPLSRMILDRVSQAFHSNKNVKNRLFMLLKGSDTEALEAQYGDLTAGKNVGSVSLNKTIYSNIHNKDILLSYSENGKRQYVSLLNSLNIHTGSMSYQSNFVLVIKESACKKSSVFYTFATQTSSVVVEDHKPAITLQPLDVSVKKGEKAVFKVMAPSAESYQWYYRTGSDGQWKKVKNGTSALYRPASTLEHDGYQYRCTVTNQNGSTDSNIVTLTVMTTPAITTQPKAAVTVAGAKAKFTVKATGGGLIYQWQYKKPGAKTWTNVSAANGKTASYQLTVKDRHDGYKYRCVVKNKLDQVTSRAVSLTVAAKLKIKTQPQTVSISAGKAASFTVAANCTGLTYRWQYRKNASGTWKNVSTSSTGYNKATLKIYATGTRNGYQYRCVIKDSAGNQVISRAATLKVQ